MSEIYDNWERLVRATLRREELWISGHRTPSDVSASSSALASPARSVSSFNFSGLLVGESFTYHQILQATDCLNASNLITHGLSGDLFNGVLEDGLRIVVKKIDLSRFMNESYLISELEFFGKVSHPRFVPLLGHCMEDWKDKFLVYKYMPNMDLSNSLYNSKYPSVLDDNVDCLSTTLDWVSRLKIATGAAEGLCFLHHECVPPLVHRNIAASSILIDENYEARLGRLTEVCTEKKDKSQNRISRLLRLPRGSEQDTSGAWNAICAYDVYCFGKVLLELVTGNSRCSEFSLSCITIHDKDLLVSIMDPTLKVDEHLFIEVWAIAIVAKACLSSKPSKRPKMTHILEALKDPTSMKFSSSGNPPRGQRAQVDSAPAKTRIPEDSKLGAMANAKFQLKIHHGGQFLMFGENKSYVGGKVSYAESYNPDHTSLVELLGIIEDLGVSTSVSLYHLLPDADMDGGLRMMVGDNDVLDMFAINAGHETINLYVEHFFTIDRNHGAEPIEANDAGKSQATINASHSGRSTALWNHQLSASSGSEVTYQDGVIRDHPSLRFCYFLELKAATRNFRIDNVLGEGRFGIVYKGWLPEKSPTNSRSESIVAVKRLKPGSMNAGLREWMNEINIIGRFSHPNLIKLLGYSHKENERFLVYEFMLKGSLVNHLFGRGSFVQALPWDIRLKILIGAARGLAFLHALERQTIHGDFKTSSILLDGAYNAKISYFGLEKMHHLDVSPSHVTIHAIGTYGYAAPEYISTGQLTMKSDVYSFGVVLAEMLTGLRTLDCSRPTNEQNLVDWIMPRLSDERKIVSIMDPWLEGNLLKTAVKMAKLTRICLAHEGKARPSMKEVVDALERIESAYQN